MKYFDEKNTEDEINKIQKADCVFTDDVVSLDDKKVQNLLDIQVYEIYLKKQSEEDNEDDDKKAGDC
jgi:hypothetical protein